MLVPDKDTLMSSNRKNNNWCLLCKDHIRIYRQWGKKSFTSSYEGLKRLKVLILYINMRRSSPYCMTGYIMNNLYMLVLDLSHLCIQNWEHFLEFLVHIDRTTSQSCCRFIGCASMIRIIRYTTSQKKSTGLRSGSWDCGGQWTHCHAQEISMRWF